MVYLIFSILSSVLVAVVIRWNESRRLDRLGVMLFNYVMAVLMTLLVGGWNSGIRIYGQLFPLSLATALIFVTAFVVYMISIQKLGIAIPVTVTRLSVVIPVLGSLLIYRESLQPTQYVGLVLALLAIYLFSWQPREEKESPSSSEAGGILLPFFLFLLMGSGDMSLKIFQEKFGAHWMMEYMLLVFFLSGVFTAVLVFLRRVPMSWGLVRGGVLLGAANFFSAFFILKVLQHLPGSLAFPLNNVGIIIVSSLVGYWIWQERMTSRILLALALAIVSVILLTFR